MHETSNSAPSFAMSTASMRNPITCVLAALHPLPANLSLWSQLAVVGAGEKMFHSPGIGVTILGVESCLWVEGRQEGKKGGGRIAFGKNRQVGREFGYVKSFANANAARSLAARCGSTSGCTSSASCCTLWSATARLALQWLPSHPAPTTVRLTKAPFPHSGKAKACPDQHPQGLETSAWTS